MIYLYGVEMPEFKTGTGDPNAERIQRELLGFTPIHRDFDASIREHVENVVGRSRDDFSSIHHISLEVKFVDIGEGRFTFGVRIKPGQDFQNATIIVQSVVSGIMQVFKHQS